MSYNPICQIFQPLIFSWIVMIYGNYASPNDVISQCSVIQYARFLMCNTWARQVIESESEVGINFYSFHFKYIIFFWVRRCGICDDSNDQHMLVQCDICQKHYHLGCLDPPLTRMPKKTAFSGW